MAVSVFPTPEGPKKINEPEGLFGSLRPDLVLRIALETAVIASSCPIILLCSSFYISSNLAVSHEITRLPKVDGATAPLSS